MKKSKAILLFLITASFLISCQKELAKGKLLPCKNAAEVWNTLYTKNNFDKQRVALEGYINLENWRQRGDEIYCEFVDANREHLLSLTLKEAKKNSVNLGKTGKKENENNLIYEESDKNNFYSIDNAGNKIPYQDKILLSFDIEYIRDKSTGNIIETVVTENGKYTLFEKYAKNGEKDYSFYRNNIRIDKF